MLQSGCQDACFCTAVPIHTNHQSQDAAWRHADSRHPAAFRNLLADGFQAHLQHNALLHQIFNFQPREEPAERLTPDEKRLYRSPASAQSKSRTQQRKSDRAASAAYKGAMMA